MAVATLTALPTRDIPVATVEATLPILVAILAPVIIRAPVMAAVRQTLAMEAEPDIAWEADITRVPDMAIMVPLMGVTTMPVALLDTKMFRNL